MIGYWVFKKDGTPFCFTFDKSQAENIARANNCTIEEVWIDN